MIKNYLSKSRFLNLIHCIFLSLIFKNLHAAPVATFLNLLHKIDNVDTSPKSCVEYENGSLRIRDSLEVGINLIVLYRTVQESYEEIYNKKFDEKLTLSLDNILSNFQSFSELKSKNTALQTLHQIRQKIINQPFILNLEDLKENKYELEGFKSKKPFTYFNWLQKRNNHLIKLKENPVYETIVPHLMQDHQSEIISIYKEIIDEKLNDIHLAYETLISDNELVTCIAKSFQIKIILCALNDILDERFGNKDDSQDIFNAFEMHINPSIDEIISLTNNSDEKIKKFIKYCAESTYILPLYFKLCCEKHLDHYKYNCQHEQWLSKIDDTRDILKGALERTEETLNTYYYTDTNQFMFQRLLSGSVLENFRFRQILDNLESIDLEQYYCNEFNAKNFNQNNISTISDLVELTNDLSFEEKIDRAKTYNNIIEDPVLIRGVAEYYALQALRENLLRLLNESAHNKYNLKEPAKHQDRLPAAEIYLRKKMLDYSSHVIINRFYLKILCYDYLDSLSSKRYTSKDLLSISAQKAKNLLTNRILDGIPLTSCLKDLKNCLKAEFLFFANKKGWDNYLKLQVGKQEADLLRVKWEALSKDLNLNNQELFQNPHIHFNNVREKFNKTEKSSEYKQLIEDNKINEYKLEREKCQVLRDIFAQGTDLKNIPDEHIIFQSSFFPVDKLKKLLAKNTKFKKAYQDALKEAIYIFQPLGTDMHSGFTHWLYDPDYSDKWQNLITFSKKTQNENENKDPKLEYDNLKNLTSAQETQSENTADELKTDNSHQKYPSKDSWFGHIKKCFHKIFDSLIWIVKKLLLQK